MEVGLKRVAELKQALEGRLEAVRREIMQEREKALLEIGQTFDFLEKSLEKCANSQFKRLEEAKMALKRLKGGSFPAELEVILGTEFWTCIQWPEWTPPSPDFMTSILRESLLLTPLGTSGLRSPTHQSLLSGYSRLSSMRNTAVRTVLCAYSRLREQLEEVMTRYISVRNEYLSFRKPTEIGPIGVHVGVGDASIGITEAILPTFGYYIDPDIGKSITEYHSRPARYFSKLQNVAENCANPALSLQIIDYLLPLHPENEANLRVSRLQIAEKVYKQNAVRAQAAGCEWSEGQELQAYYHLDTAGDGETSLRWALQVARSEVGSDPEGYEKTAFLLAQCLYVSREPEKWQEAERVLSRFKGVPAKTILVLILLATGRLTDAAAEIKRVPDPPPYLRLCSALISLAQGKRTDFDLEFCRFIGKTDTSMAGTWLLGWFYYLTTEIMGELNGEKELPAMFEPVDWGIQAWGLTADFFPIFPQLLDLIQTHILPQVSDLYTGYGLMRLSLDELTSFDFPSRLAEVMQGIEPNSYFQADLFTITGYYHHIEKHWNLAEQNYQKALKIHKFRSEIDFRTFLCVKKLALAQFHSKQFHEAIRSYQFALHLAKTLNLPILQVYNVKIRLGNVWIQVEEMSNAEREFREALDMDLVGEEDKMQGWVGLAEVMELQGLQTQAENAFLTCISNLEKRAPESILRYLSYLKYAGLLVRLGNRWTEAKEYVEKAGAMLGSAPAVELLRKQIEDRGN